MDVTIDTLVLLETPTQFIERESKKSIKQFFTRGEPKPETLKKAAVIMER